MQLSGAQIIVQSLHAENVEYVFGYPGGAVLEIYDAIYQLKKFVPAAKWALPWLHQDRAQPTR